MRRLPSATTVAYDTENRLISAAGAKNATLGYDPLGRLAQVSDVATRRMVYDGLNLVEEYDGSGNLLRRHAFAGLDEPILTDEGAAMDCSGTKFPRADERGSIVALADCWGGLTSINSYDEFGVPQATNVGRFGYTGQAWVPELGLWYYKARMYAPTIGGRFLQPDPIGYAAGPNLYAYVLNDPVNWIDPMGLRCVTYGVVGGRNWGSRCDPLNGFGTGLPDLRFHLPHKEDIGGVIEPGFDIGGDPVGPARPEYCQNELHQWGMGVEDLGKFLTKAGLAMAVGGAVTGVGAAGGSSIAALGATTQGLGTALKFLGGEKDAWFDLAAGALGTGATNMIPRSLRNDILDVVANMTLDNAASAVRGDKCGN